MSELRIDGDQASLHVEQHGAGPDLVLVHGQGQSTARVWRFVLPGLARRFRVTAYDQRGHDRSTDLAGDQSVARHAGDLVRVLDRLGIARCHLLGFSFGGLIAQLVALDQPGRLRSLMLVSTTCGVKPETHKGYRDRADMIDRLGMESYADTAIARVLSPGFVAANPDIVTWYREVFVADPAAAYAGAMRAIPAFQACGRVGAIACPVLVMGGSDDDSPMSAHQPGAAARELHRLIPSSKLVMVDGVRHYIQIETPGRFVDELNAFVAGIGA